MGKRAMSGCAPRRCSTAGSSKDVALLSATFLLSAHFRNQPVDDDRTSDAFRLRLEVREDAVRQHRLGDCLQIFHAYKVAALKNSMRLGATNQVLHRAGTRAPCDPFL